MYARARQITNKQHTHACPLSHTHARPRQVSQASNHAHTRAHAPGEPATAPQLATDRILLGRRTRRCFRRSPREEGYLPARRCCCCRPPRRPRPQQKHHQPPPLPRKKTRCLLLRPSSSTRRPAISTRVCRGRRTARGTTGLPRPARQRPIVRAVAAAPASLGPLPGRKSGRLFLFCRNHVVACDAELPPGIALPQGETEKESSAGEQGAGFL